MPWAQSISSNVAGRNSMSPPTEWTDGQFDSTVVAPPLGRLVGRSTAIQRLRRRVQAVAMRDVRTLIMGPSGSGKELVAEAIHALSRRRLAAFEAVNCAALPRDLAESELFGHERGAFTGAGARRRGLFELADGGTIFLDEVSELPLDVQAKLLRVLELLRFRRVGGEEDLRVDVRVLAASNQNLTARVATGHFRGDLFHRLDVATIVVPSLAERREDIPDLVRHFLRQLGAPHVQVSTTAQMQLQSREWPGNVRELRNTIERALVFARDAVIDSIEARDPVEPPVTSCTPTMDVAIQGVVAAFTSAVDSGSPPRNLLTTIECALAVTALTLARGNKALAARWLDIDRKTLSRRLASKRTRPAVAAREDL